MLQAIGDLLAAIVTPLGQMADQMAMTVGGYTTTMGLLSNNPITNKTMATNIFAVLAGSWIENSGNLINAVADFLTQLSAAVIAIA